MIWLDYYRDRDQSSLGYSVSRHNNKSVQFDKSKGLYLTESKKNLIALKESLGATKFNKLQTLINECLKEGMEIEITIPKNKVVKEGLFSSNKIKGIKKKSFNIYVSTRGGNASRVLAKYFIKNHRLSIDGKEVIINNVENNLSTVKTVLHGLRDTINHLLEEGSIKVKEIQNADITANADDGSTIELGFTDDYGNVNIRLPK